METQDPYDALSRFAISVFDVNSVLLQSGERVTRPIGQSSARWQVLGRAGYMPQTVARMAREIGNSRQAVQRLADALEKEGLISFVKNPAHKRAQLIQLTPKGQEVLAEIDARDREWSWELLTVLEPKLLIEHATALENIAKIFRSKLEKGEI